MRGRGWRPGTCHYPEQLKVGQGVQVRQSIHGRRSALSAPPVTFTGDTPLTFVPDKLGHVSDRIAQMTGSSDPEPLRAHLNHTDSCGVFGTDLGIPVEHGGALHLFFGDEEDPNDDDDPNTDADPIFTTERALRAPGFKIQPILQPSSTTFPAADSSRDRPARELRGSDGWLQLEWQTLRLCREAGATPGPAKEHDDAVIPRQRGRPTQDFHQLFDAPIDSFDTPGGNKFINVAAAVVNNADWAWVKLSASGLPSTTGQGLLIWGRELA